MSEGYNKVTVTFEWPPDKWMGYQPWAANVQRLLDLAEALGMDDGRPRMEVVRERVSVDE